MKTIENKVREEVRNLSSTDLRKRASELKIKNYSRFTKDQLQKKVIEVLETQVQDEFVQEEVKVVNESIQSSDRDKMADEVDEFVDSLIENNRNGVYNEVMKALGGKFDSDLDYLLDNATEEQLKEALNFKKIKYVSNNVEEKVSVDEFEKKETSKLESASKAKKTRKLKDVPRANSKSAAILEYLKEHPTISKYAIAKHFDTYYSVVDNVEKRYILK